MAAGLGFIEFSTGDVLSAAAANGYLASQTVMVFASAAARTSAITSPQEGMFSYLKDTDATQFYDGAAWTNLDTTGMVNPLTTTGDTIYSSSGTTPARLGIGSSGQVLTVAGGIPSWATPSSGGSMTLLSTTTFSGSSVNLTAISGSYKHLYLQWYGLTNNTADGYLDLRLNNNSGSVYNCYRAGTNNTTTYAQGNTSDTYLRTGAANLDRTSANNAGNMYIYNYASASNYKVVQVQFGYRAPSSTNSIQTTTCLFLSNTAVDQVNFFLDNAATFSAGTVQLYGVN